MPTRGDETFQKTTRARRAEIGALFAADNVLCGGEQSPSQLRTSDD
jgi:hypothetical protein